MKLIINITISIGIYSFLEIYSGGHFEWVFILFFILCCLATSVMLAAWTTGGFKERIKKTMPFAFPINTIAVIVGYAFETIKVL